MVVCEGKELPQYAAVKDWPERTHPILSGQRTTPWILATVEQEEARHGVTPAAQRSRLLLIQNATVQPFDHGWRSYQER